MKKINEETNEVANWTVKETTKEEKIKNRKKWKTKLIKTTKKIELEQ